MARIGLSGYLITLGLLTAGSSIALTNHLSENSPQRPSRPSIVERVERISSQTSQYQTARDTTSTPGLQTRLDSTITRLNSERDSLVQTQEYSQERRQYVTDSTGYERQRQQEEKLVYLDVGLLGIAVISLIAGLTATFRSKD